MENQRKTVALICEYNPFHFGHQHQLSVLKEKYGCIMGIMSGAFVQRGQVAVEDKYRRAESAVCGGMNLVLELPFPYCVASAKDFAAAGVDIAAAMGADALAFGCEDGGELLTDIAKLIATEEFEEETASLIKADPSLSFPRARAEAIRKHLGDKGAEILSKPNNILGAEYIAHAIKSGYDMDFCFVKRDFGFKSSTKIREGESFEGEIPFPRFYTEKRDLKYREREIISLLRKGVPQGLYCVDASLAATLKSAALKATSLEELVAAATGKTYTAARVRRGIVAAWLGIGADAVKAKPIYTNLLAADKKGLEFLSATKKSRALSVVTKPADYKKLPPDGIAAAEAALIAEEEAALCTAEIKPYISPLTKTPFIG